MPTPIVQIDVNDERFKQFKELFDRHRQNVDDLSKQWDTVTGAAGGAAGQTAQVGEAATTAADATASHVEATKELAAATGEVVSAWGALGLTVQGFDEVLNKATKTVEELGSGVKTAGSSTDDLTRKARVSEGIFQKLSNHSGHISKSVKEATASLMKWTEIGAAVGLLGGFAGSLFGFDKLSVAAGNMQRSAAGLGVTPGEQTAFRINYQRYVDADTVLGNVAEARSDYTKRAALLQMGFTNEQINREDPAQLAVEASRRAAERFRSSDQSVQFAQATGLTQIFTMADLRRLAATPQEGIERAQTNFQRDAAHLNVSQETLRQFQNFNQQLSRAGSIIETDLIRRLVSLTGPLENLSDSIVHLFEDIINNPHVGEWLNDLSAGINHLATYLKSPQFETDIKKFFDKVADLVTETEHAAKTFYKFSVAFENSWFYRWMVNGNHPDQVNAGNLGDTGGSAWANKSDLVKRFTPESALPPAERVKESVQGFERLGLSQEAAVAMTAQEIGESGLDPNAVNPTSGAWGLNQLLGGEKKTYDDWAVRHGFDPMTTSPEEQREFIVDRLKSNYPKIWATLQDPNATVADKTRAIDFYERYSGFEDPNGAIPRSREALSSKVYAQIINQAAAAKAPAPTPTSNDDLPLVMSRLRAQQQRQQTNDNAPAVARPADHDHNDRAIKQLARHLRRASRHHVTINVNNPAGANVTLAASQAAAQ